jgi:hypothetical protein
MNYLYPGHFLYRAASFSSHLLKSFALRFKRRKWHSTQIGRSNFICRSNFPVQNFKPKTVFL